MANQNPPPRHDAQVFDVTILPAGISFSAPADMPLMAAARAAGITLAASCRNGTCRTCMCRLVRGDIRYALQWPGLSAEEKAQGWILPCVAHAVSPLVIEEPRAVPAA